ncbi:MAG: hypothetical protein C0507_18145 [Cyanobacteria bacterium PR.3.49]|jgi:hypothetical protein|nr:hypothetical protein [Cyanobacteria bacterium PR.3.49]
MKVKTQIKAIALLTPILILSLAPAGLAGNEPVKTSDAKSEKVETKSKPGDKAHVPIMDRPEMADFKRVQVFAFKYRQKLRNLDTMLTQAKRVGAINDESFKKMRTDLDKLNEDEPGLARNGWKQSDVDAFEKRVQKFEKDFAESQPQNSKPANKK